MRFILTILLAIHAALHVLGFLKWSKLALIPALNARTLFSFSPTGERVFAGLWLLALLVLLAAVVFRIAKHDIWWVPALGGVLLSQCLITIAWHDAKFGTIANVLILVPTIIAAAHMRFGHQVDAEVRALLAQSSLVNKSVVERAEIDRLPMPVRRWLETSGSVGRERARSVRLKQSGAMRTAPDSAWMPAMAEQYFSINPPAFVWQIDTTMMGFLPIAGRDKYTAGHGHMLIKAASIVNIVDVADQKIDLGSLLRFLGEMVWFPSAALSPYITWESIDATSAKATMQDKELAATAIFLFNERGQVVGMRAERYLGGGADAKLTPWLVSCSEWRVFEGIEIPSRGSVGWSLASGEFTYYRWEILDLNFNPVQLYDDEHVSHREPTRQPGRQIANLPPEGVSR